MKFKKVFFVITFFIGTFYLLLPVPKNFPDLPGAVKSTEPGDTVQIANVSAYYTDMPRKDVVRFYQDYFSRSPFLGIPLITYKLNHPPERIREVLRDTQQSTYVEELIHPLRESVFINGFEWNNDPFTSPGGRIKNILVVNGKTYQFKVTLYYQESKIWQRILIFYLILILIYLLVLSYRGILKRWQKER
ncbi:hypothetical protein COS54_01190 [Candidatus Shapirobacteria bacterium CG03_land_8_20_14_0_80_39_12]|uniref:Uncharacterized protein n=1 Tax=Candidatus Shapirobacteria bacterium CG03_land_8_20_14_0_80_39_12 TaxID=1974879 RepID=A0A2M7BDR9_9BACT|nr:MAG: hypothetical protein COS54_01190 [Candidatus Shapirobacteria bacterium CG03_land_8_20_14_0_80_39_12]